MASLRTMSGTDSGEGAVGDDVDLAGNKAWYDTAGAGEPLLLMHGGLCTNDLWGAQLPALSERFQVLAPERRGHGHTLDVDRPLRDSDMAADAIAFLEHESPATMIPVLRSV